MITDIPTSTDFQEAGINLLNLAWDSTVSLLSDRILDGSQFRNNVAASAKYWRSAQPILTSSLSLVQQSIEFYLKSKIAQISPYLLLAGTPSNFPKNSSSQDTSFSDFRSIDAQDLIRVHDTVSNNRLSREFCQWYDDLRRLRNKVMHTVDKAILITDKDVLIKVLEGCEYCIGAHAWIQTRSKYLMSSPGKQLLEDNPLDHIDDKDVAAYHLGQLQSEILTVIEYLEPRYSEKFFGFQKKKRRYICLHCLSIKQQDVFFEYKDVEEVWLNTAQLDSEYPNTIHCIICDGHYLIKAAKCVYCGNNVVDAQNGLCLSCTYSVPKGIELQISRNWD